MRSQYYTYMVRCKNGELYTGYTVDVDKRIKEHNTGRGAKYTRGRGPVQLIYLETFSDKEGAMVREAEIKKMPRSKKLALTQANTPANQGRAE